MTPPRHDVHGPGGLHGSSGPWEFRYFSHRFTSNQYSTHKEGRGTWVLTAYGISGLALVRSTGLLLLGLTSLTSAESASWRGRFSPVNRWGCVLRDRVRKPSPAHAAPIAPVLQCAALNVSPGLTITQRLPHTFIEKHGLNSVATRSFQNCPRHLRRRRRRYRTRQPHQEADQVSGPQDFHPRRAQRNRRLRRAVRHRQAEVSATRCWFRASTASAPS